MDVHIKMWSHYDACNYMYVCSDSYKRIFGEQGWRSGERTRFPPLWPGFIPGPGVICGLSLLLVLVPAPRVFLRVLRFFSLRKNKHFQTPIRSGIQGPQVCQSQDCYMQPSLNKVDVSFLCFASLADDFAKRKHHAKYE